MMLSLLLTLPALQDPIHVVMGDEAKSFPGLGSSVAGGVDHDLDGVPDFLAGNPYHAFSGRVMLYDGVSGDPLIAPIDNDHPSQYYFGWSVAPCADLDGDGLPDVLVGARQVPFVAPVQPGFADVRSSADGALILRVDGTAMDDSFGIAVAGLGDVNGDSIGDFAVGATQAGDFTTARGYVRLCSGSDGATIRTILGMGSGDHYGAAVANVGDVTGDGVDDVLAGAPGEGTKKGYAEVRNGATGALVWRNFGAAQYDRLGAAVAPAGDVDLDGVLDVIVGAPGGDYARVLRATDGALVRTLTGPDGDSFGGAVAGLGDVDGDGIADLLVGAKTADGPVNFTGAAWIYSGLDGGILRSFTGKQNGDRYGISAAAPGDLDLDGLPDALVGASQELNSGPGFAEVRVGRPPLVTDVQSLSVGAGGAQTLDLDAQPGLAGELYVVLGTLGATSPGVSLLGVTVPLTADAYFAFTLSHPNTPPLTGSLGTLDAAGEATATFALPAGLFPTLAGATVHHAFGVLDLAGPTVELVSNAARLDLLP